MRYCQEFCHESSSAFEISSSIYIVYKSQRNKHSHFSLIHCRHAQHLCTRWGHAIWQKQRNQCEFLQIPSSHFARLVITFFLKIPLAAYPNVTKNCNSRGIKQFNGQKLRDFHFLSVFGARGNSENKWNVLTRALCQRNCSATTNCTHEHTEVTAPILEATLVSEGVSTLPVALRAILQLQHTPVN